MKEIQNAETVVPIDTPPVIGSIHSIPLSAIHPTPNNPFQIRDDPAMNELIESVSQFGILVPIEVRPTEFGDYEMISGSRRQHACIAAGLDAVPAIILSLDDDDAIIRMVDSNIQRENILPSERAHAYKMRNGTIDDGDLDDDYAIIPIYPGRKDIHSTKKYQSRIECIWTPGRAKCVLAVIEQLLEQTDEVEF